MEESKEVKIEKGYLKLTSNLDELTKIYRMILELLRKEKEALIQSDYKTIEECHQNKETMLYKARSLDSARERYANELGWLLGTESQQPRLLELSQKMGGPAGDRLRTVHSTMEIIIKRVVEMNKENEKYTQSALKTLDGALGEIKETLSGKKTYEKKGQVSYGPDKAGNFVSKEA